MSTHVFKSHQLHLRERLQKWVEVLIKEIKSFFKAGNIHKIE